MQHSKRRENSSRSAVLASYRGVIDRIDKHLELTYPEVEDVRIQKAIDLLFGVRPTSWVINIPEGFPIPEKAP